MPNVTPLVPNTYYAEEANGNIGWASDTFKLALIAAANAPTVASSAGIGAETTVSLTNLSGNDIVTVSSSTQTNGLHKVIVDDRTIAALGGSIGPFRYVVVYNDTHPSDQICLIYDYGTDQTLSDGESMNLDFSATDGVLQIRLAD